MSTLKGILLKGDLDYAITVSHRPAWVYTARLYFIDALSKIKEDWNI